MTEPGSLLHADELARDKSTRKNLALRVVSALVLAPLAIVTAYIGGWPFAVFWALGAVIVWWEWSRLINPIGNRGVLVTGICVLVLEFFLAGSGRIGISLLIMALGALAVTVTATRNSLWIAGGVVYASVLLVAPTAIRGESGFVTIVFLFAVVWSTDILGYFVGRAIGGPRLAVAISPNKTWSGAIGGTIGALAGGVAVASLTHSASFWAAMILALVLSIMAQAGDLFESMVKRRFAVKDAGSLIPGHGGVMDRIDGFIAAAAAMAVIGAVQSRMDDSMQGFFLW